MATSSSKSRSLKQRPGRESASRTAALDESQSREAPVTVDVSERTWRIACVTILALAAVLRIYDLNLVPLHHDEGVNGNFLVRLVRDGVYHYDPANYHGPTLYYFAAFFPWILRFLFGTDAQNTYGLTTIAVRLVPALFGLATVGLVLTLRRNLGTIATLTAAGLLAVSPGAVYLSRYFIHETLFVFFALGIVVASLKYFEEAHPVYLILAAVSTALLFATKETAVISTGVLAIALVSTHIYRRLRKGSPQVPGATRKKKGRYDSGGRTLLDSFVERVGGPTNLIIWIVVALAVFIVINVLFYSSFFTNYPKGVSDAFKTFQFWTKTGREAHVHPFVTYIYWLLLQESPLLVLGVIGAAVTIVRPNRSFALFSALWAFGLLAAYSLIAYKTPWLALNFIVPLSLTAGVAIEWLYQRLATWEVEKGKRAYAIGFGLLLVVGVFAGVVRAFHQKAIHLKTFIPGYQTLDLNFVNYDNDNRYYVYVYAHTRRQTLKLIEEINRIAQRTHQGGATGISIVSPDYWPLPWYLRDYNRVGYYGRITRSNEPIIIASEAQTAEVQATFGDRYKQVQSGFNTTGSFPLRPGVDLLLYTRRELVP